MNIGNTMSGTVTIPEKEYKELRKKARAYETLGISKVNLEKKPAGIKPSKNSILLSEKALAKDWLKREEDRAWKSL